MVPAVHRKLLLSDERVILDREQLPPVAAEHSEVSIREQQLSQRMLLPLRVVEIELLHAVDESDGSIKRHIDLRPVTGTDQVFDLESFCRRPLSLAGLDVDNLHASQCPQHEQSIHEQRLTDRDRRAILVVHVLDEHLDLLLQRLQLSERLPPARQQQRLAPTTERGPIRCAEKHRPFGRRRLCDDAARQCRPPFADTHSRPPHFNLLVIPSHTARGPIFDVWRVLLQPFLGSLFVSRLLGRERRLQLPMPFLRDRRLRVVEPAKPTCRQRELAPIQMPHRQPLSRRLTLFEHQELHRHLSQPINPPRLFRLFQSPSRFCSDALTETANHFFGKFQHQSHRLLTHRLPSIADATDRVFLLAEQRLRQLQHRLPVVSIRRGRRLAEHFRLLAILRGSRVDLIPSIRIKRLSIRRSALWPNIDFDLRLRWLLRQRLCRSWH